MGRPSIFQKPKSFFTAATKDGDKLVNPNYVRGYGFYTEVVHYRGHLIVLSHARYQTLDYARDLQALHAAGQRGTMTKPEPVVLVDTLAQGYEQVDFAMATRGIS